MKDMARRMERGFGRIMGFIGRICVAAFLASLSSNPVVQNKDLNNFLISIAMFAGLLLWEQTHRMKALGGLASAWVMVKVFQWNTPSRWHYDIAFFVFLVLVFYVERRWSEPAIQEEKTVSPYPATPSA